MEVEGGVEVEVWVPSPPSPSCNCDPTKAVNKTVCHGPHSMEWIASNLGKCSTVVYGARMIIDGVPAASHGLNQNPCRYIPT